MGELVAEGLLVAGEGHVCDVIAFVFEVLDRCFVEVVGV